MQKERGQNTQPSHLCRTQQPLTAILPLRHDLPTLWAPRRQPGRRRSAATGDMRTRLSSASTRHAHPRSRKLTALRGWHDRWAQRACHLAGQRGGGERRRKQRASMEPWPALCWRSALAQRVPPHAPASPPPVTSSSSSSLPGTATSSSRKPISALEGMRGLPGEAERPLSPNASLPGIVKSHTSPVCISLTASSTPGSTEPLPTRK
mmetsp:Transcript_43241/g.138882  ORF Transcript_43241/g.138882 Transcript_43241/m.138882 type:complete len:207 (-) Transcript_43241:347-967(-)